MDVTARINAAGGLLHAYRASRLDLTGYVTLTASPRDGGGGDDEVPR